MKLTSYFIKHPVSAIILNVLIVVVGVLCWKQLSVREYPNISFPMITVKASYPNASPNLVETSLTNILEDYLAGIEGLETITSQSMSGSSLITLAFRPGVSMDRAVSATQDAVGLAKSFLPPEVRAPVVERQKKSSGLPFMAISLESSSLKFGALTHYANVRLKNLFRSVSGVSSVDVFGQPFIYTVRLSPEKLYTFGVNVDEVVNALIKSHISLPVGNYRNKIPSTLKFNLKSQSDYEHLLIKDTFKRPVFLKDVASIQLETDNTSSRIKVNGHSGLVLAINRTADANPVEVSKDVRAIYDSLIHTLPADLKATIILDQADFINASIKSIQHSIIEAVLLVLVIVFLFLRTIRATIIPLVAIPISLLGSLIFLKLFGFSLNLMTLLAMVLAIGLVVDDAIIVLENIWRHVEEGQKPLAAAFNGAKEIGFAIIAMTFTLTSVYLPIAFIDGMLGQLFIEFAVALAGSVMISGVVALTLSPLMCGYFFRESSAYTVKYLPFIDRWLDGVTTAYANLLLRLFKHRGKTLLLACASLVLTVILYHCLTQETAPKEDRGLIGIYVPSVSGEDIDMLDKKIDGIEKSINQLPEAENKLIFMGDWGASLVLPLQSISSRKRTATTLVDELKQSVSHYPSIDPVVWSWDTGLPGLENAGTGTELSINISTQGSYRTLMEKAQKIKALIEASKQFEFVSFDLRLDSPGYSIEMDHNQMALLGIKPSQVAKTIEVFFSGDKTQSFEKNGITYQVFIMGSHMPWTLDELYINTANNKRISLGAIAKMVPTTQPGTLNHFKQMRSTTLHVQIKEGDAFASKLNQLWTLVQKEMSSDVQFTWTGAAKAFFESSNTMVFLIVLSLGFIYAILAIQFQNFIDPLVILVTVPCAFLGALLFLYLFGQSLNIYSQVGIVTLVGLISKHGILIVEFANQLRAEGIDVSKAIQTAARLRIRPILMTTSAMVFGAVPLLLSSDAGFEARHAIGVVLIGGLIIGTLFTLLVVPVIYVAVFSRKNNK